MFILAHGFSPWSFDLIALNSWQYNTSWQEHMIEEDYSHHGGLETERERGRDPIFP